MKKLLRIVLIAGTISGSLSAAEFDIGISGSDRGINGFSLSIGDYYHVPQQEIVVIERSIPRDEMSVAYFLARKSHRDAQFITNLRLRGLSWWDISLRLGLDPRTLYVVETRRYHNPPYGKAYGYSKNKKHRLKDAEIVELVNVRFLSEYHRISPDEVIQRRRGGEHYDRINDHYKGKKESSRHREERREERHDNREDKGGKEDRGHHGNPHDR